MKKLFVFSILTLSAILLAETPFQIGFFNPVQLEPESESIKGVKLNLINSANSNVTGIDLGFFSEVKSEFTGLQWNFVNLNSGNTSGVQFGEMFSTAKNMKGLQSGFINRAELS
ncbi:MAG TPA: hypothetical protein PKW56_06635, partial [Clostridiales bacterium]|nr:hypothetical protein [Clostridiales bacterium]